MTIVASIVTDSREAILPFAVTNGAVTGICTVTLNLFLIIPEDNYFPITRLTLKNLYLSHAKELVRLGQQSCKSDL